MTKRKFHCFGWRIFFVLGALFFLVSFFPGTAFSQDSFCGEDDGAIGSENRSPLLEKSGSLKAKVIFVNFPLDSIPIAQISDARKANLDSLCSFITEISLPTITMDWGLIPRVGDVDSTLPWGALFPSNDYRQQLDPEDFPRSGHWWADDDPAKGYYGAALLGEVLYDIKEEYEEANLLNPFENTDILIVNYIYSDSENGYASPIYHPGYPWVGGYAKIPLKPYSEYETEVDEYFSGLGAREHQVLGTQNVVYENDLSNQTVLAHEFGHTINLDHTGGFDHENWEERYAYGLLDVMTSGFSEGKGCQTFHLQRISQTGNGFRPNWYPVEDFTGQNLYDEIVYDIRHDEAKTYRFTLDDLDGYPQYFLFAYHGKNPVDIPRDQNTPLAVLQGLEVQHCYGPSSNKIIDLESAFGRFDDTPPNSFVEQGFWTDPNPIDGYDNHDSWQTRPWEYYEDYQGHVNDFFSATGKSVFGFTPECNPNTHGIDPSSNGAWRRRPNNQENTLYVRVKSQHDDYMVVDFLSAPYEEVTITSGTNYTHTDSIDFSYTITSEWEGYLTSFDVYFCPTSSGLPLYLVAENVPYDTEYPQFSFDIQPNFGTALGDSGQVIVRFKNNITSYTGDVTAGPIHITDLSPVITESILFPLEGDHLIVGRDARIEWSSSFSSDLVSEIDVIFDSGTEVFEIATLDTFNTDWFYDNDSERYWGSIPVTAAMITGNGAIYLQLNNIPPGFIEDIDVGGLVVLPPLVEYNDVSGTAFSDGGGYSAPPKAIVPISEDKDNLAFGKSLILSLMAGEDQDAGVFFENTSTPDEISFNNWSPAAHFPYGEIMAGASAIAAADYDGDGDEDFFVCSPTEGASALFKRNGEYFEKTELGPTEVTNRTNGATWIDFDHDGDLDLFLVRGIALNPLLNVLFENDSISDSFSIVENANGLVDSNNPLATRVALWADFDLNGYWEVIIGEFNSSEGATLFNQNSEGQFIEATRQPFSDLEAVSIVCQDFNRDNQVDLVFGENSGKITLFLNNNGIFSPLESYEITTPFDAFQISHGDFDNDGWLDLLITSGDNDEGFCAFKNVMGQAGFDQKFINISDDVDIGNSFGFPQTGMAKGAIQSDLDLDGDLDFFVGMPNGRDGGAVWKNENAASDWLGIKLVSTSGASPIGATVMLIGGGAEPLGCQVFGDSGGRGAQGTNDLVFGLNGPSVPVKVYVKWPSRNTTSVTIADPNGLNQFIEVSEPTLWCLDSQSPDFEMVVSPDKIDWVFIWETEDWTPSNADWIDFSPSQNCGSLTAGSLVPGVTSGVSVSLDYSSDPSTGEVTFLHTLTYEDAPCYPGCGISFTVHSGNPDLGTQSSNATGSFPKLCPISTGN